MNNYRLKPGDSLGERYEIKRLLGQGGFGITYIAYDKNLENEIVIKEYFPAEIAGRDSEGNVFAQAVANESFFEEGKKRFLNEARVLASLFEIPGVVKVIDFFEMNNTAYIVMEYVDGVSLRQWLESRDECCSFDEAYTLLRPIMEALKKIHKKGLLHRDITPDNIMVDSQGNLKLLDFGAAREFLSGKDAEKTMTVIVKEGYAPAEQYEKKGRQGPWTDVYSICATMYEMMTGCMLQNSLERTISDEIYMPSEFGVSISQEQESMFIAKGLSSDPVDRFQSMDEMITAFSGKPVKKEFPLKFKILAGACAVLCITAAVTLPQMFKGDEVEARAGSYDRGSERYEEFVTYVKEHAIEEKPSENHEGATTYTLSNKDVKAWGETDNRHRFEITADELIKHLESKGHQVEKLDTINKNIVDIMQYGAIETSFQKATSYIIDGTSKIHINSELLSDEIYKVMVHPAVEKEATVAARQSEAENMKHTCNITSTVVDKLVPSKKESTREFEKSIYELYTEDRYTNFFDPDFITGYEFREMYFVATTSDDFDNQCTFSMFACGECGNIYGEPYAWPR